MAKFTRVGNVKRKRAQFNAQFHLLSQVPTTFFLKFDILSSIYAILIL